MTRGGVLRPFGACKIIPPAALTPNTRPPHPPCRYPELLAGHPVSDSESTASSTPGARAELCQAYTAALQVLKTFKNPNRNLSKP